MKHLQKFLRYIKPVFYLAPLANDAAWHQRIIHGLILTAIGTVVGIFVLAFALNQLAGWPKAYRYLTKWANQPPLPVAKRCIFMPVEDERFKNLPALSSLRKYTVSFDLDTSLGNKAYGIAFVNDQRFGPYAEGYSEVPRADDPQYIFLPRRDYRKNPPKLTVIYDASDGELDSLEFESSDCPVHLEFFEGEK